MTEFADRLRERAKECRDLSATARDQVTQQLLLDIADDLDAEAGEIEAGNRAEVPSATT